jgi:hypothetical protein
VKSLLALYPKSWRSRYEAEVSQMIEDSRSGPRDVPGLLRGAIDAHAHPRSLGLPEGGTRGWFTLPHVSALLAILAGVAWMTPYLALFLSSMRHSPMADTHSLAMTAFASPLVTLAMAGLLLPTMTTRRGRLLAAMSLSLMGIGAGVMLVKLVLNWASPDVPILGFNGAAFMSVGTALVLAGTIVGSVALWGMQVARRSLVELVLAALAYLSFLVLYRDTGFVIAVGSFVGAMLGAWVGLAWVKLGRSAIQRTEVPLAASEPSAGGIRAA